MPAVLHRLRNEGNKEVFTLGAIAFAFNMLLVRKCCFVHSNGVTNSSKISNLDPSSDHSLGKA